MATNWLSISRAAYGVAALAAPGILGGHVGEMRLAPTTRRTMQILAARQLLQAGVCAVAPTRCVLALEAVVDGVHALTMVAVSMASRNDSHRRAAAVNVATAGVFVVGDYAVMSQTRIDATSPAASGNRLIRACDQSGTTDLPGAPAARRNPMSSFVGERARGRVASGGGPAQHLDCGR